MSWTTILSAVLLSSCTTCSAFYICTSYSMHNQVGPAEYLVTAHFSFMGVDPRLTTHSCLLLPSWLQLCKKFRVNASHCMRQGLMLFGPHCCHIMSSSSACLHHLRMAVVACWCQHQRWQRARGWHGSGWQWSMLLCEVAVDVVVWGSGRCHLAHGGCSWCEMVVMKGGDGDGDGGGGKRTFVFVFGHEFW